MYLKTISKDIARAIQVCGGGRRPASAPQRLCATTGRELRDARLTCAPAALSSRAQVGQPGQVLARVAAYWFSSRAQTCCGQPVRPLILFSPGPRAGGKPSC